MEEHLPLTLITDLDLTSESLAKYRVLILPNAACLSDEQCEVIRNYVRHGGGLVATCETSLCDELGGPRENFALQDVFGTSYAGRVQTTAVPRELDVNFALAIDDTYWAQRANAGAFRFSDYPQSIFATDPRLKKLVPNMQATFKGPLVRPGAWQPHMQPAFLFFPEGSREPFPVAAVGEFGQGRVVYFGAGLDAAYFSYGFPYQRVVLSQALHWAAGRPYRIQLKGPMCVQSTFWRQASSRLIVHCWNGLNTTSDHGLQEVETPLREEAVDIHGMELRLQGVDFSAAHCEPGHLPLSARRDGETTVISLPPLSIHYAVVLEDAQFKPPTTGR
jgi:hypothetical protein